MTRFQRMAGVLVGVLMLLSAAILILFPVQAAPIIVGVICLGLLIYSIRTLWFFFTMARFMVNGQRILIKGVIALDLALLSLSLTDIPQRYIMYYLLGVLVFSGAVDIMRGLEMKKQQTSGWQSKLIPGAVCIIIALIGGFIPDNIYLITYVFCAGVIYSAVVRIVSSLRRSAIISIQ